MGYYLTEHRAEPTPETRPVGRPRLGSKTPIGAPFLHTILSTKYWDEDTKTVAFQLRDYGPGIGRWLSRDPIGDEAFFRRYALMLDKAQQQRLHAESLMPAYVYSNNNPANFIDPFGLALSYSDCKCCPGIDEAVSKANNALNSGACRKWFEDHGHDYSTGSPSRSVTCYGNWKAWCWFGVPAWTFPGMGIAVCNNQCEKNGPSALASYLIHELAHHYCPVLAGREACAISAQDACAGQL